MLPYVNFKISMSTKFLGFIVMPAKMIMKSNDSQLNEFQVGNKLSLLTLELDFWHQARAWKPPVKIRSHLTI